MEFVLQQAFAVVKLFDSCIPLSVPQEQLHHQAVGVLNQWIQG